MQCVSLFVIVHNSYERNCEYQAVRDAVACMRASTIMFFFGSVAFRFAQTLWKRTKKIFKLHLDAVCCVFKGAQVIVLVSLDGCKIFLLISRRIELIRRPSIQLRSTNVWLWPFSDYALTLLTFYYHQRVRMFDAPLLSARFGSTIPMQRWM